MRPYRTIFRADIVQISGMTVGGTSDSVNVVDAPFCRDGLDRLTLRGEGLGGGLVATARRIYGRIPDCISCEFGSRHTARSRWIPHTSHPNDTVRTETRNGVGIRHDTGARADGVLFSVETTPRFTTWPFVLEVVTFEADGSEENEASEGKIAERMAAAVLLEWQRDRCWLGADVARGLGWARIENLRALRLTTEHADFWPDSGDEPATILDRYEGPVVEAIHFDEEFPPLPIRNQWFYVDVLGSIDVGERGDGYGVDAIAVGGQMPDVADADLLAKHFHKPDSLDQQTYAARSLDLDETFAMTWNSDASELEPFLPGAGLRGPLRHTLSRQLRAEGTDVRDPNVDRSVRNPADPADALFGSTDKSAALLVCDAYLQDGYDWQAACLNQHAEDEFTAGAYSASLFQRALVMSGRFDWRFVIEYQSDSNIASIVSQYLYTVMKLGHVRQLPLGGAKWRGAGWPEWTVRSVKWGSAGEDPMPMTEGLEQIEALREF